MIVSLQKADFYFVLVFYFSNILPRRGQRFGFVAEGQWIALRVRKRLKDNSGDFLGLADRAATGSGGGESNADS